MIKHVGRYRVAGILESDVSSESHPPFHKHKASIPPLQPRQMKSVGRALHSVLIYIWPCPAQTPGSQAAWESLICSVKAKSVLTYRQQLMRWGRGGRGGVGRERGAEREKEEEWKEEGGKGMEKKKGAGMDKEPVNTFIQLNPSALNFCP